jgi:dTMP kinase
MTARGLLVALCGIDGSGKTTQELALEDWLRSLGRRVLRTQQPTSWYRSSEVVRAYLDHGVDGLGMHGLALFAAADRQRHVREVLEPALAGGTDVICNRYVYSTYAYFMARGLPLEFLRAINPGVPRPELTVLLDVSPSAARERVRARDGAVLKYEERQLQFMQEVRRGLLDVADESFLVLDGMAPVAETQALIRARVARMLEMRRRTQVAQREEEADVH